MMWHRQLGRGALVVLGSSAAASLIQSRVSLSCSSTSSEIPFSYGVRALPPSSTTPLSHAVAAVSAPNRDDYLKWDGKVAIRTMLAAFTRANADLAATGDISPLSLIEAARANVAIYGHIFGSKSVLARVLAKTTARQLNRLEATMADPGTPPSARASLKKLLLWEIRERGEDWGNNRQSCAYCVKWLGRGLSFIGAFMAIFSTERDVAPHQAARRAYDIELRPFHGAFVAMLARTAFYYAPRDRMLLYVRFSYVDSDGCAVENGLADVAVGSGVVKFSTIDDAVCSDLAHCSAFMLPVLAEIKSFLQNHRLNSSDKSVVVFAAND
jgi:hypothetical protein